MGWPGWFSAVLGALLLAALAGYLVWRRVAIWKRQAIRSFLLQREQLEAAFLDAATATGKPRGLRWLACDWDKETAFARDRQTGRLTALVAVTIRFEAIEGSDMEGVAAVGNLRNASAVYFFDRGGWRTGGKAVFNLNPAEALEHLKAQYDPVSAD
jgi:hypothetical protein